MVVVNNDEVTSAWLAVVLAAAEVAEVEALRAVASDQRLALKNNIFLCGVLHEIISHFLFY